MVHIFVPERAFFYLCSVAAARAGVVCIPARFGAARCFGFMVHIFVPERAFFYLCSVTAKRAYGIGIPTALGTAWCNGAHVPQGMRLCIYRENQRGIGNRRGFIFRQKIFPAESTAIVRTHTAVDAACRNLVRPNKRMGMRRSCAGDSADGKLQFFVDHFRHRYGNFIRYIDAFPGRDCGIGFCLINTAGKHNIFIRAVEIGRETHTAFCKITDKTALQRLSADKLARAAGIKFFFFCVIFIKCSVKPTIFKIQCFSELRKRKLIANHPFGIRGGNRKRIRSVARKSENLILREKTERLPLFDGNKLHGG